MLFKEQKFFRKRSIFPSFHLIPFGVIHISWTLLWAIYKAILNRTATRDLVLRGATVIAVVHEIQVCYETKWNLHCRFIAILPLYKWNRFPLKGNIFQYHGGGRLQQWWRLHCQLLHYYHKGCLELTLWLQLSFVYNTSHKEETLLASRSGLHDSFDSPKLRNLNAKDKPTV